MYFCHFFAHHGYRDIIIHLVETLLLGFFLRCRGEFALGDGRTIMKPERIPKASEGVLEGALLPIAPGFRMIVLANRPGYPFLGNDFYRECGDVFASQAVENPDVVSEVELLRSYGPNVPQAR